METKTLVSVLERKRDKIREILDLTSSAQVGDTVDAMESYVEFIDQREILVNEAKEIEAELNEAMGGNLSPDGLNRDEKRVAVEIDELINQIVAHEEGNRHKVELMMESIKEDMKKTKEGLAAKNYYHNTEMGSKGQYFDEIK
jgi:hypothetical protein